MSSDTPFNPISIPEGLRFTQDTTAASQHPEPPPDKTQEQKTVRRKRRPKRKQRVSAVLETTDVTSQSKWQRLKGQLNARLASLDAETLKRILTAAGVAAGVIIAVIVAIKLTPIGLALLAILGLAFLLRHLNRFF